MKWIRPSYSGRCLPSLYHEHVWKEKSIGRFWTVTMVSIAVKRPGYPGNILWLKRIPCQPSGHWLITCRVIIDRVTCKAFNFCKTRNKSSGTNVGVSKSPSADVGRLSSGRVGLLDCSNWGSIYDCSVVVSMLWDEVQEVCGLFLKWTWVPVWALTLVRALRLRRVCISH